MPSNKVSKSHIIAEMEKKIDELEWSVLCATNLLEAKTEEAKKSHSNNADLRERIAELENQLGEQASTQIDKCRDGSYRPSFEASVFNEGAYFGRECGIKEMEKKIYVVDAETGMMTDKLIADKWKKWTTPNFMKWRTRIHAERCAFECVDDASDLSLGKYIEYLEHKYDVEEHTALTDSDDE